MTKARRPTTKPPNNPQRPIWADIRRSRCQGSEATLQVCRHTGHHTISPRTVPHVVSNNLWCCAAFDRQRRNQAAEGSATLSAATGASIPDAYFVGDGVTWATILKESPAQIPTSARHHRNELALTQQRAAMTNTWPPVQRTYQPSS